VTATLMARRTTLQVRFHASTRPAPRVEIPRSRRRLASRLRGRSLKEPPKAKLRDSARAARVSSLVAGRARCGWRFARCAFIAQKSGLRFRGRRELLELFPDSYAGAEWRIRSVGEGPHRAVHDDAGVLVIRNKRRAEGGEFGSACPSGCSGCYRTPRTPGQCSRWTFFGHARVGGFARRLRRRRFLRESVRSAAVTA